MRLPRSVAALVATAVLSAGIFAAPTAAMANTDDTVTSTEIMSALNATDADNGNLVAEPIASKSDEDSAAVTNTTGGTIDIAKDPDAGVTIDSTNGPTITVGLPNADEANTAKKAADGTVIYSGSDGSASALIPASDGLQMLVTIANSEADTDYTYPINTPAGGSVELTGGGAIVKNPDGTLGLTTPTPWAHDADGVTVPTSFKLTGKNLTLVVDHKSGNYRYPIVADPFWSTFWAYVGCITGIGAPIATAIIIAGLPASWPFLYRWAANQSAQGDRTIINYINRVHNACSRFMSS